MILCKSNLVNLFETLPSKLVSFEDSTEIDTSTLRETLSLFYRDFYTFSLLREKSDCFSALIELIHYVFIYNTQCNQFSIPNAPVTLYTEEFRDLQSKFKASIDVSKELEILYSVYTYWEKDVLNSTIMNLNKYRKSLKQTDLDSAFTDVNISWSVAKAESVNRLLVGKLFVVKNSLDNYLQKIYSKPVSYVLWSAWLKENDIVETYKLVEKKLVNNLVIIFKESVVNL